MTNSITSLSNDGEPVAATLTKFLQGEYSTSDLQEILSDRVEFDFQEAPDRRAIVNHSLSENIAISVNASHVRNMLDMYMNGKISALTLSNWAAVIVALEAYVPEGETDDERWLAGEGPVWDILQQLTTPSVFGDVNESKVQKYIGMIDQR